MGSRGEHSGRMLPCPRCGHDRWTFIEDGKEKCVVCRKVLIAGVKDA